MSTTSSTKYGRTTYVVENTCEKCGQSLVDMWALQAQRDMADSERHLALKLLAELSVFINATKRLEDLAQATLPGDAMPGLYPVVVDGSVTWIVRRGRMGTVVYEGQHLRRPSRKL